MISRRGFISSLLGVPALIATPKTNLWAATSTQAIGGYISIGIDDGIVSANQIVALLERYKLTADIFPIAGYINSPDFLTSKQLVNLYSRGHRICNHTYGHFYFSTRTDAQVIADIRAAKNALRSWGLLGDTEVLALPGGDRGSQGIYVTRPNRLKDLLASEGSIAVARNAWPENPDDINTVINTASTFDPLAVKVYSLKRSTIDSTLIFGLIDYVALNPNAMLNFVIHDLGAISVDDFKVPPRFLCNVFQYIAQHVINGTIRVGSLSEGSSQLIFRKKKLLL